MNYQVGDTVQFKGIEQKLTLLGEHGDYVWLKSDDRCPQTFLKDGLEKVPVTAPIYIRMYKDDGSFSIHTYESKGTAFDCDDCKVIKVSLDECGNPKAEWVYEQSNT